VGIPYNTASHLPGPYKVPNFQCHARVVATNKVPNAPYRGAGRPEAAQAVERMMDLIAGELGLEPAEVRRRNLVQPQDMPYSVGIPYRDGQPVVYDGGDYPAAMQKAIDAIGGIEAFRQRQREERKRGVHIGLGLGLYAEGTGVGPFEGAVVRIESSGKVYISSGACTQGQGMETVYSQLAADLWKVKPEDVVVSLGDTSAITMGFGTIASRSTVNVSAALHFASERLRNKVFALAAEMMECGASDLELRDGYVGVNGAPGMQISLGDLARAARPGWDSKRPAGMDAGLQETYYWEPPTVTWAYGAHAAVVRIDTQLGKVTIDQYVVAHDCGVVVNPLLADGQIIGGVAQGIGGALLEGFNYDANGQLLTGSFMDYLLPTAGDIPRIQVIHQETPSPLNPFGVKGLGEGGAIGPPVVIANAVCDALAEFKVEFNATPITPEQIVNACARR
jgi:carbon-monoxide dehydrogenase large subunit